MDKLYEIMSTYTDKQLEEVVNNKYNYSKPFVDCAILILNKRMGVDNQESVDDKTDYSQKNFEVKRPSQIGTSAGQNDINYQPNWFIDFISFKRLISTTIIQVAYIIGTIAIIIYGFRFIVEANSNSSQFLDNSDMMVAAGIFVLTVGNLIWRIICESAILLFRHASSLSNIERYLQKQG